MTWNKMLVFRLVDKKKMVVSRIVYRLDGEDNRSLGPGYLQGYGRGQFRWIPTVSPSTPQRPPTPTILSTLFALMAEAVSDADAPEPRRLKDEIFISLSVYSAELGAPASESRLPTDQLSTRSEDNGQHNPSGPAPDGGLLRSSSFDLSATRRFIDHGKRPTPFKLKPMGSPSRQGSVSWSPRIVSLSSDDEKRTVESESSLIPLPPVDYHPPSNCATQIPRGFWGDSVDLATLAFAPINEALRDTPSLSPKLSVSFVTTPSLPVAGLMQIAFGPDELGTDPERAGVGFLGRGRTWTVFACDLWLPPIGTIRMDQDHTRTRRSTSPHGTDDGFSSDETSDSEILITPEPDIIPPPIKAVVKICRAALRMQGIDGPVTREDSSPIQKVNAVHAEARLYGGAYRASEGVTVPPSYGLFRAAEHRSQATGEGDFIYVMVCARAGNQIGDTWQSTAEKDR